MSRGLGKVEREIIKYLVKKERKIASNLNGGDFRSTSIGYLVYHIQKDYQSICRAVRNLEKKGMLISNIITTDVNYFLPKKLAKPNINWIKVVRLSAKFERTRF